MDESWDRSSPVTPASATIGYTDSAESDGGGIGDEGDDYGLGLLHAESRKKARGDCDRRAEASGSFKQGSKTEGDEDGLNTWIAGGTFLHPSPQEFEFSRVLREVVEP